MRQFDPNHILLSFNGGKNIKWLYNLFRDTEEIWIGSYLSWSIRINDWRSHIIAVSIRANFFMLYRAQCFKDNITCITRCKRTLLYWLTVGLNVLNTSSHKKFTHTPKHTQTTTTTTTTVLMILEKRIHSKFFRKRAMIKRTPFL